MQFCTGSFLNIERMGFKGKSKRAVLRMQYQTGKLDFVLLNLSNPPKHKVASSNLAGRATPLIEIMVS